MPGEQQRARTARTRAKIKHALAEVMRQKGFDALTVSDVARAAGLNRGTIYLHFSDKDDMLAQLEGEVVAAMTEALLGDAGQAAGAGSGADASGAADAPSAAATGAATAEGAAGSEGAATGGLASIFTYERILAALRVVTDDFEFVSAVAGKGGDPEFETKLRGAMRDLLDRGLERGGLALRVDEGFGEAYARELAFGHVMTIVDVWLSGDGTEDPEQVARMICTAQTLSPAHFVA